MKEDSKEIRKFAILLMDFSKWQLYQLQARYNCNINAAVLNGVKTDENVIGKELNAMNKDEGEGDGKAREGRRLIRSEEAS